MLATHSASRALAFFAALLAFACLHESSARADTGGSDLATTTKSTLRLRPLFLADVVVQSPPATQPVEVAPTPVAEATPRKVIQTDVHSHNYMATMAWSAISGGVLGAAVGTALYYIDKGERARNIAYWAAGGVLVGAGVGLLQVMVEESRTSQALSSRGPADPAPTLRLALYQHRF